MNAWIAALALIAAPLALSKQNKKNQKKRKDVRSNAHVFFLFSACHFASFDFLTKPFYENAILEKSLLAFSVAVVYRVRKRRGTRRGSFLVPSPSFIQSRNQSLKQEQ
jgi:hypothetical protein